MQRSSSLVQEQWWTQNYVEFILIVIHKMTWHGPTKYLTHTSDLGPQAQAPDIISTAGNGVVKIPGLMEYVDDCSPVIYYSNTEIHKDPKPAVLFFWSARLRYLVRCKQWTVICKCKNLIYGRYGHSQTLCLSKSERKRRHLHLRPLTAYFHV